VRGVHTDAIFRLNIDGDDSTNEKYISRTARDKLFVHRCHILREIFYQLCPMEPSSEKMIYKQ